MRLLLDTHTLLWVYWGDPKLSATAAALVTDPGNSVYVSPASYWEIAIKVSTSKLVLRVSYDNFITDAITNNGFTIFPIEPRHTEALTTLPMHHRDPFDRLVIAQAMVEQMPILSSDAAFDAYPVTRLW